MAGMAGLEPANAGVKVPCLTTWLHPNIAGSKAKGRSGRSGPSALSLYGVDDGTRTRDTRNHNPMLYQLNYIHHGFATPGVWAIRKHTSGMFPGQNTDFLIFGTPEGTRTPDPLLRRQLLYPPELQAHMERVMGIEPTRPAWKAGILPLNYTRIGTVPGTVSLFILPRATAFVNSFFPKKRGQTILSRAPLLCRAGRAGPGRITALPAPAGPPEWRCGAHRLPPAS